MSNTGSGIKVPPGGKRFTLAKDRSKPGIQIQHLSGAPEAPQSFCSALGLGEREREKGQEWSREGILH